MPYKMYLLDRHPDVKEKVCEFFKSIEWAVRSFITDRMPDADYFKCHNNLPQILIGQSLFRENFKVKKQINIEIDLDGQRLVVLAFVYINSGPGRSGRAFVLEPIPLTALIADVQAKLEEALQKISAVPEKDLVFMGDMAEEVKRQRELVNAEPIFC